MEFLLQFDDLEQVAWQEVIAPIQNKSCIYFNTPISEAMKSTSDEVSKRVFDILSKITSFHFRPENVYEPYGPMIVMKDGSRSVIPEDLKDQHLEVLGAKIELFEYDLKARIADVIWLQKKDFPFALIAIESYLSAADFFLKESDTWVHAKECIERAFRLSKSLGKGGEKHFDLVVDTIQDIIFNVIEKKPQFFSLRLMELLRGARVENWTELAELSESIAILHEKNGDYNGANSYWINTAYLYSNAELYENEKQAYINAAECYVKMSENSGSALAATKFLQQAIESYRRLGGHQEKTDALYTQLLAVQEGIGSEMQQVSVDMDLTKLVEQSVSAVEGKSMDEAIHNFCLLTRPQPYVELMHTTEKRIEDHPLQYMVSKQIVDTEGKIVAEFPSMIGEDVTEGSEALEAHMIDQSQFHRATSVNGAIEPARLSILLEHNISINTIMPLVINNPFVAQGREYIVAKGLVAGFHGEWIDAVSILIPQFEEAIRHVLKLKGEVVSGMDEKNLQDDRSLNTTLKSDLIADIFGKDLAFELKGLLISRYGPNLRNRSAHGLMHTNEYYADDTVYFWWLYLRLVVWPFILAKKREGNG